MKDLQKSKALQACRILVDAADKANGRTLARGQIYQSDVLDAVRLAREVVGRKGALVGLEARP